MTLSKGHKRYLSKSVACGTSCSNYISATYNEATNYCVGGNVSNFSPSNPPGKVQHQHQYNQQTISKVTRYNTPTESYLLACC